MLRASIAAIPHLIFLDFSSSLPPWWAGILQDQGRSLILPRQLELVPEANSAYATPTFRICSNVGSV